MKRLLNYYLQTVYTLCYFKSMLSICLSVRQVSLLDYAWLLFIGWRKCYAMHLTGLDWRWRAVEADERFTGQCRPSASALSAHVPESVLLRLWFGAKSVRLARQQRDFKDYGTIQNDLCKGVTSILKYLCTLNDYDWLWPWPCSIYARLMIVFICMSFCC